MFFVIPFMLVYRGGYGSSTWEGLVPTPDKQNTAINISMPTHVNEGGGVWGLFGGYELSTFFAIEASYMHYKDATVSFDEDSLFAFDHEDRLEFTTKTSQTSVMAKVMLTVPGTSLRGYSSAGIAGVSRKDEINSRSRVSPTFGVGVNYNINPRVMLELAGNYTAGYGESELNPIRDYVPFLYSVFLRAAIRV
ncbi:MAG: outer membrane beta-barrel protein [Legionellaceae bacterium]